MVESCDKSCLRREFPEQPRPRERETEHICANAAPNPKLERISVNYQVCARRACGA